MMTCKTYWTLRTKKAAITQTDKAVDVWKTREKIRQFLPSSLKRNINKRLRFSEND